MRREAGWAIAAIAAFTVGSACAKSYARLAGPYYAAVARFIAAGHPWEVVSIEVKPSEIGPGSVLALNGNVRRQARDERPAARVVARVQVGEVIETPMVFWTLLLIWPAASARQRLARCAVGLPIFAGLEAVTTAVQLMHNLPEVSALLAGEKNPLTLWERWSRFLEGGGRYVVEMCAVVSVISIERLLARPAQLAT